MSPQLHVAFIATECVPFVKIGGLADVISALPMRLSALGIRTDVVIPRPFDPIPDRIGPLRSLQPVSVTLGGRTVSAQALCVDSDPGNVRLFLVGGGGFFPRQGLYADTATGTDYPDQFARWVFFQRAAMELLAREAPDLNLIHCHEHQTALVPAFMDVLYRPHGVFPTAGTVLTIHNLGYQGIFSAADWSDAGLESGEIAPGGRFEYYGQINLMKGGILSADAVTVVSPTYGQEIQTPEYGYGLDGVIRSRGSDLVGILNGIDEGIWNPESDTFIARRYGAGDLRGKTACRRALLSEFALDENAEAPVFGVVSRIDPHKGFDLLLEILDDLLDEPVRFVLLGAGDPEIEEKIGRIVGAHPGIAGARFGYDEGLSHRIMAGADIFLMPSRYEPCGLTQMYALRYGTVPVVRATGGLADTVEPFDPKHQTGNGFRFEAYDAVEFRAAIGRAIGEWRQRDSWKPLMQRGMREDFGWERSARRYIEVYEKVSAIR